MTPRLLTFSFAMAFTAACSASKPAQRPAQVASPAPAPDPATQAAEKAVFEGCTGEHSGPATVLLRCGTLVVMVAQVTTAGVNPDDLLGGVAAGLRARDPALAVDKAAQVAVGEVVMPGWHMRVKDGFTMDAVAAKLSTGVHAVACGGPADVADRGQRCQALLGWLWKDGLPKSIALKPPKVESVLVRGKAFFPPAHCKLSYPGSGMVAADCGAESFFWANVGSAELAHAMAQPMISAVAKNVGSVAPPDMVPCTVNGQATTCVQLTGQGSKTRVWAAETAFKGESVLTICQWSPPEGPIPQVCADVFQKP